MTVDPHHPLQEAIGRMLFGIEDVPPDVARRMVSQTARMAVEYVQATEAERKRLREALEAMLDPEKAGVTTYEIGIMQAIARAALQEGSDE